MTYGELCSDVGDPIKVSKKMCNPLIFSCVMNVTKECIVRWKVGHFYQGYQKKFEEDSLLHYTCIMWFTLMQFPHTQILAYVWFSGGIQW